MRSASILIPRIDTQPRHARRGFTVTELVVCIGIIAVLVGILVPTVTILTARVHRAQTLVLLAQLAVAFDTYQQEEPRHLFPPPRSDGLIGWNVQDPTSCGALLASLFQPSAGAIDRSLGSPSYQCLIDGWRRGLRYQLDGPVVAANALLDTSSMLLPPQLPAPVVDWNPSGAKPFAYLWSLGEPAQGLPADAASANVEHWLYRHVAP